MIVRKAVLGMVAAQRFKDRNGTSDPEKERLAKEVQDCKDEAEHVSQLMQSERAFADIVRTMRSRF
jgi:hypothetical protein